jgi:hypothetical protein
MQIEIQVVPVINGSRRVARNVNRLVKDSTTTLFDSSQQQSLADRRRCISPVEIATHGGSCGDADLTPLIRSAFERIRQAPEAIVVPMRRFAVPDRPRKAKN